MRRIRVLELFLAVVLGSCGGTAPRVPDGPSTSEGPAAPVPGAADTQAPDLPPPPASPALSSRRALMIKERMKPGPDWTCFEDGNFLILHSTLVKPERIREVAGRLQALLKVLSGEYPMDGLEGALFVVRICKDRSQYGQYGGPGGTSAYWSPMDEEMVSYFDESDRKGSIRHISSILVHAYLSQAMGSAAPHEWFSVGLSSFYYGCNSNPSGTLVPGRNLDLAATIRKAKEGGTFAPLEQFLRDGHAQFHGQRIFENYAQAWSFAWFLKMQRDPEWSGILSSYYTAFRSGVRACRASRGPSGDAGFITSEEEDRIRESAWEAVFGGFDGETWRRLERAWLEFN